MERGKNSVLAVAGAELMKEKKGKKIHYLLISSFLLFLFLFLFLISLNFLELTGYSTSVDSQGGYVTELDVTAKIDVEEWGGFYGLVLSVPGFTQQLSESLESGTIERSDVFFDCIQTDAEGGPEVYASINPSLDLAGSAVVPGTAQMVDNFINCTGEVYCANETFTNTMSVFLGSTNISGIPSTFTYKYNGQNEIYDIGVLNVSDDLVFVAHVNSSIQEGFNQNVLVNYQMLLPTPPNTTQTYYFYADPNDACPSGGIGTTINATIYGYVTDESQNPVDNATVTVAGYSASSNSSGFYNLSTLVISGTYSHITQKSGYDPNISTVMVNFSNFVIEKNVTLPSETPAQGSTISPTVFGYVNDTSGALLSNVTIYLGNGSTMTNGSGYYTFSPLVTIGSEPIIAVKTDYDNYYEILNFSSTTSSLNHNFTMEPANLNNFPTGPFTEDNVDNEEGDEKEKAKQEAEENGQDFWISTQEINKQVRENTFIEEEISIYNFKSSSMQLVFRVSPELEDIITLDKTSMSISPDSFDSVTLTISGTEPIGVYRGTIDISGGIEQSIPAKIEIVPKKLLVETLGMEINLFDSRINLGGTLKYRLNLENLLSEQGYKVDLKHLVTNPNGTIVYIEENEEIEIKDSLTILKEFKLPEDLPEGDYQVSVEANYLNLFSSASEPFSITRPLYLYAFFGIPLWLIFLAISLLSFLMFNFFIYSQHVKKKKRYHLALKLDTLPKPGDRSIILGKIAERKNTAYYNIDDFTTHGIVAGATGGGKSISAQVFVEEALEKDIAVVVFDPTAQWSGMLRKCDDKKMLSFYSKFGLKPSDAKAFKGNVRQITNEKQSIDVSKYMNPGQIQIFTLNKLTPQQIDVFVAGVINNIFKSDPKEHPNLRMMLVFDEVHRLLPKFGGSGKGFLQIERACREFRKWGFGVMLVSQVLSDFVGEIKANINTEVQMRVAEEKDLERIKERYGLDALKSLVRAGIGTGMIQNAEYNKGLPYFVSFRPILHNTRRLSDEVLSKYNKYNEIIDDLEYQIEQLEKEKVDIFDLKMELKLVKDKLMTGNFTVVDIYLEGIKPRIEKQWEKISKKPKKKEIELIDVQELESSLEKAQKDREKWQKENKKPAESKQETKKEDKSTKIVAPLTFDNGIMISSLKELKETLPNLDESVFKLHVNQNKNDISNWVSEQIEQSWGEKLKSVSDKQAMITALESLGKESGDQKSPKAKESKSGSEKPEEESKEKEENKKPAENKQETKKEKKQQDQTDETTKKSEEKKPSSQPSPEKPKEEK